MIERWQTPWNTDGDERLIAHARTGPRLPLVRIPLRSILAEEPDEAEINFMDQPPTVRRYKSGTTPMTAPDTRDIVELLPCPFCDSDQVSLSEGETGDGQPWPYVECESCAATATPDNWNRRTLPQQAGGEDGEVLCHKLHTSDGKKAWRWVDGPPNEQARDDARNFGWELELAYSAEYVAVLQAEVARLTGANDALADALREANKGYVHELNRAETAEAALREAVTLLRETGRFLDPRHYAGQIGKLTAFLDKAALNGGQDDG